MEFKEYLKEQIKKADNDDELLLLIYFDKTVQFKYHKGCYADFQEDFCIVYDKDVNMCFRYDSVKITQLGNVKDIKKDLEDDFFKFLIGEVL